MLFLAYEEFLTQPSKALQLGRVGFAMVEAFNRIIKLIQEMSFIASLQNPLHKLLFSFFWIRDFPSLSVLKSLLWHIFKFRFIQFYLEPSLTIFIMYTTLKMFSCCSGSVIPCISRAIFDFCECVYSSDCLISVKIIKMPSIKKTRGTHRCWCTQ